MSPSAPADPGARLDGGPPSRAGLRFAAPLTAFALLALATLDRLDWARLSQWREDQATNLWLGFTRGPLALPVGLVSSVGVPNPNGMPLLGVLLSRLPGLLAVSWVLGAVQAALAVALCFSLSLRLAERALLALLLLSSVLLRGSSVELWNQWLLTSLDLAFALSVVRYLRRPSIGWLPVWVLLALVAPSLYLAGLVNGLVFAGIAGLLLLSRRPAPARASWAAAILASALLVAASAWITWVPYFREIGTAGITAAPAVSLLARLLGAVASLVQSPLWWPTAWVGPSAFVILQSNPEILSPLATGARRATDLLLVAQHVTLLAALALLAWQWRTRRAEGAPRPAPVNPALVEVAWIAGIVLAAHVVSPLVGGPAWARGERMDMALQWFPLLLVAWFGGALALPLSPPARRGVRAVTVSIALALVVANLILGRAVQDSYLAYRGPVLVPADVPLLDKLAVVDFVADDWRRHGGGGAIPIDYDLGGGIWDWVPTFGSQLERWYPAPMTLGRAFDYELLRRHGLANDREGMPRPTRATARYVVGYASFPPPWIPDRTVQHVPIGRLRVTVVEPPGS